MFECAMARVKCTGEEMKLQADVVGLPPQKKKKIEALQRAVSDIFVDPRSSVGQQFSLAHKPGTQAGDEYRALGRAEAADFRMRWAKKQYAQFAEGRTYEEKFTHTDWANSKRMTLRKMIRDQGDDVKGIIGCLKTCHKCSLMGFPWIAVRPQTERVEYMLLSFGFTETVEKAWTTFKREFNPNKELSGGKHHHKHDAAASSQPQQAIANHADASGGQP